MSLEKNGQTIKSLEEKIKIQNDFHKEIVTKLKEELKDLTKGKTHLEKVLKEVSLSIFD